MPFEESCERLDGMLRESVQEHLSADVPVSVWLSGGLDSSTILHYASQCGVARPKTFSVAFENASCDERRYFREMACAYGTDHCEMELRADASLPCVIEKLAHYSDEPGADAGALPVWYLSQLTAGSATVALSGEGGDELFGGYSTYLADAVAKRLRSVPALVRQRALNAANRYLPVSDEKISFEYKIKRLLEGSLLPADASHQFWNGTFSEQQKRRLLTDEYQRRMILDQSNRYPLASEIGFLNRYLLIDQSTYLPDNILYKVDRMSMAHSVEVRPALLDHRIVEFAARLPERYKIRGWTTKYILRQTMKSKLPALILKRPKRGFDIPTHEWFRGVLRPLLLDTLASDAVRNSGIFNLAAVRQLVESHMERKQNVGYHLWGLMTLGLWLQHWNIETAAVRESSQPETAAVYGT
jgi:asparagine synthase (glutamine-hydrolysing)